MIDKVRVNFECTLCSPSLFTVRGYQWKLSKFIGDTLACINCKQRYRIHINPNLESSELITLELLPEEPQSV